MYSQILLKKTRNLKPLYFPTLLNQVLEAFEVDRVQHVYLGKFTEYQTATEEAKEVI